MRAFLRERHLPELQATSHSEALRDGKRPKLGTIVSNVHATVSPAAIPAGRFHVDALSLELI
jgi:hypothetical protein